MCLLYDAGMGYLLVVRSASGKVPLYWGLDEGPGTSLVISSAKFAHLSDFPPGCAYESQALEGSTGSCRMLNICRHTPAARRVDTISQVDSHGHLCGLMFKSKSGRDLVADGNEALRDVY
jgi:hypothetical protein